LRAAWHDIQVVRPLDTNSEGFYNTPVILNGWKDIAAYLHCSIRTAQRWELEGGLPISRPVPYRRSCVLADSKQLDRWLRNGFLRAHHHRANKYVTTVERSQQLLSEVYQSHQQLRLRMKTFRSRMSALLATRSRRKGPGPVNS
jgi:hypothetical protein